MKKLMLLMLASGFLSMSAHAEVGRDKSAPNCQQVIQSIQDSLKKNRPVADSGAPVSDPASSGAATAQ